MSFRLCRSVDCNVVVSKSQTWTKDWFFFSIIIECDMKFTSSVDKISYKWALYGCKTLKTSQRVWRVRNAQSLLISQSSQTRSRNRRIFLLCSWIRMNCTGHSVCLIGQLLTKRGTRQNDPQRSKLIDKRSTTIQNKFHPPTNVG